MADWNCVFKDEAANLFNYFLFRTNDRTESEDLCSQTFELAWRKRRRFDPKRGTPGAWLVGIGRRVYLDHLRRRRPPHVDLSMVELVDQRSDAPDEAAIRTARRSALHEALADLPGRGKEIIAMKFGAELTNREIACLIGVSETNVGTIASRMLRMLRARFCEEDWNETG